MSTVEKMKPEGEWVCLVSGGHTYDVCGGQMYDVCGGQKYPHNDDDMEWRLIKVGRSKDRTFQSEVSEEMLSTMLTQ